MSFNRDLEDKIETNTELQKPGVVTGPETEMKEINVEIDDEEKASALPKTKI